MLNIISIINFFAFVCLVITFVIVILKKQQTLLFDKPILAIALAILAFVSMTNFVEHAFHLTYWDRLEDIIEILFFPLFVFAMYSNIVAREYEFRKHSERKFRAIFNQTFTFVGLLDCEGRLLEANRASLKFSGIEFNTIEGVYFWLTPWWKHSTEEQDKLKQAIKLAASGEMVRLQVTHPDAQGVFHIVDFSIRPIIEPNGEIYYLIPEGRDITHLIEQEQELINRNKAYEILNEQLRQAKDKAEESDMLKTAFLASINHEIRTPMNGILGFAQLLKLPDTPPEKHDYYIKIISDSTDQLLSIIGDLIDISHINAGLVDIDAAQVIIADLELEVNLRYAQLAKDKGLNFEVSNQSDLISFTSDFIKLMRLLNAIISNAIKFTDTGSVSLVIYRDGEEVIFAVKDTGIGIAKNLHTKIFDNFWRAETNVAQKYGGTGLGLSICRGYVGILHGKIWLESVEEEGTTFYISLPLSSTTSIPFATFEIDEKSLPQ